jgi:hypothetical protein
VSESTHRPVFIGGCGRSGTTLLGSMLGTHPHCLTTPEASFFYTPLRRSWATGEEFDRHTALDQITAHWSFKIWDVEIDRTFLVEHCSTYPELLLGIVAAYGRKTGKIEPRLWVDHAPGNVKYFSLLLEMFPEARLIHIVRDARAASSSVIPLDWGPNNAASAARWWVSFVARGLAAEAMHGPVRVIRIRYEDLVARPEPTLKRVCDFAGIDYRPEMVAGTGFGVPGFTAGQHALIGKAPDRSRLEAWRKALSRREIEIVESIAVDLLSGLGYATVHGWRARRLTSSEKARFTLQEIYRRNVINRRRLRRRIRRSLADIESRD